MSEEYTHVGTVRRRPRTGYQRSQSSSANGEAKSNGNGSHTRNGRDSRHEFERDSYFDKGFDETSRESRRSRARPEAEPRAKQGKERARKPVSQFGPELEEEPLFRFPFDPWRLYGAAKRNFGWILVSAAALAVVGFFLAMLLVPYKVNMLLIRITSSAVRNENAPIVQFTPREYSEQTLFSFMKSSEVLQSVSSRGATNALLSPIGVTPQKLSEAVSIKNTSNPDYVQLSLKAFGSLPGMVELANIYGEEVTEYTKEIQQKEAKAINALLRRQVAELDEQLRDMTGELRKYSESGVVDFGEEMKAEIANVATLRTELQTRRMELEQVKAQIQAVGGSTVAPTTKLEQAREELKAMLLTKKPAHPDVQQKQAEIAQLEKMPNGGGSAAGTGLGTNPLMLSYIELQTRGPGLERRIQQIQDLLKQAEVRLGGAGNINKAIEFEIKNSERKQLEASRKIL